jgi:Protein of unknown function (DUF2442)
MHKVLSVIANEDFTLDLKFADGSLRKFDVKPYLEYGVFKELKEQGYFKKVRVVFGTVQWPNEQDISPDTLYLESAVIESAYV